jgi:cytidylate kinase
MTVLTISGQTGSGAREVGRLVAERLQLDYIDQQILIAAARSLGVPMESVATYDERTAGMGERIANMMRRFFERSAAAGASDPMLGAGGLDVMLGQTYAEAAAAEELPEVSEQRYAEALTGIVRDLAAHDDVLIIGRGSQVVLHDWPGAFHVLLVAPKKHRVSFLASRDGISEEEAAKRMHDNEKGRIAYHQRFFKADVNDPALYDITLNTGRLEIDGAADVIVEAVRRRAMHKQPT